MKTVSEKLSKILWLINSSDEILVGNAPMTGEPKIQLDTQLVDIKCADKNGAKTVSFSFDAIEKAVAKGRAYVIKNCAGKANKLTFC
ncbi:hypothetical protein PN836_005890 [Ningiella sp. W23]|uniref:hypothetical protein n=1 Tax=Ningiella sp. W23 TaxID=3023715 RepID=UPI003756EC35